MPPKIENKIQKSYIIQQLNNQKIDSRVEGKMGKVGKHNLSFCKVDWIGKSKGNPIINKNKTYFLYSMF